MSLSKKYAVLMVACALALAGCSGEQTDEPASASAEQAPEQMPATEAAPEALETLPEAERPPEAVVAEAEQAAGAAAQAGGAQPAASANEGSGRAEDRAPQDVIINSSGMSFVTAETGTTGVAYAMPGDRIVWRQMMMGGHNTEAYDELIPEGADDWKSRVGENQYLYTVEEPGLYLYKCTPHEMTGMIGALIVGEGKPHNLDAVLEHELTQTGPRKRFMQKVLLPELEDKGWVE